MRSWYSALFSTGIVMLMPNVAQKLCVVRDKNSLNLRKIGMLLLDQFPNLNLIMLKVTFMATVEVKLQSCPSVKTDRIRRFHIYPVGLTEKLTVNIELDCQCSCGLDKNKVSMTMNKCFSESLKAACCQYLIYSHRLELSIKCSIKTWWPQASIVLMRPYILLKLSGILCLHQSRSCQCIFQSLHYS